MLSRLVHGPFGQSNMHCTLDFCPDQTSQEGIECTKAKGQLISKCLLGVIVWTKISMKFLP